jgi:hypothetical protein
MIPFEQLRARLDYSMRGIPRSRAPDAARATLFAAWSAAKPGPQQSAVFVTVLALRCTVEETLHRVWDTRHGLSG